MAHSLHASRTMLHKAHPNRLVGLFTETFGLGRGAAVAATAVLLLTICSAAYLFFHSAPPSTLTMTSGPEGSIFEVNAQKYAKALARSGVKLKILPSRGSEENLARLSNPRSHVEVGFVQCGVTNALGVKKLVSLGSIAYEPLMIFYSSKLSLPLISDFAGKRLAIGSPGSGSRALALTLLATNGVTLGGATTALDVGSEEAVQALEAGKVDVVFLMSDSVASATLRKLLHDPAYKLFDFTQADGYTRRFSYLNKLEIPAGSVDFGKNLPAQTIHLIGPTVELIAGADIHPAMSDLLLDAAREIHGNASLLQKRGEFPAPLEHDITISADAIRYYKSGKSFLYRRLPFWMAGLVERVVVMIVPSLLVLIPGLKLIPAVLRLRVKLMLFRWYRELLAVERGLYGDLLPDKRKEMLAKLDFIEAAVKQVKVPATYADQFYGLRANICHVRERYHSAKA